MTDREMLMKAAKAAGLCVDVAASANTMREWHKMALLNENMGHTLWNPLTDDGDALRLAVKLRFAVRAGYAHTPEHGNFDEGLLRIKQDADAATRRAIVRAAAAIGDRDA